MRRKGVEPCTGESGSPMFGCFWFVFCSFFERALPQNVGGAKRTRAPHPRVWLKHTPLRSRGENRVPLLPTVASHLPFDLIRSEC